MAGEVIFLDFGSFVLSIVRFIMAGIDGFTIL